MIWPLDGLLAIHLKNFFLLNARVPSGFNPGASLLHSDPHLFLSTSPLTHGDSVLGVAWFWLWLPMLSGTISSVSKAL